VASGLVAAKEELADLPRLKIERCGLKVFGVESGLRICPVTLAGDGASHLWGISASMRRLSHLHFVL
jgi:hypothetical protein